MSMTWRLANINYIGWLLCLLGFSFQFSMGATNVAFYLIALSCLWIIFYRSVRRRDLPWREIWQSPLWRVVTVWILLLALSITYSDASDKALLFDYARKYAKYLLVGVFAVVFLLKFRLHQDLPKYFFWGLVVGGVVSIGLSVLNGTTGWLTLLAQKKVISGKHFVHDGYWISNEFFAYSLFMAVVSLYAVTRWLRTKNWALLLLCPIGLFGIFVVSYQRTGFVAFIALVLWLIWSFIPKIKWKILALVFVSLLVISTLSTKNKVSQRIYQAAIEFTSCHKIDLEEKEASKAKACYSSIGLRMLFYKDSFVQIEHSPLYGNGLANMRVRTLQYKRVTVKGKKKWQLYFGKAQNPHNEYLLQGIHLGIGGILLVIAIFALAYRYAMQISSPRRYLYAGIVVMYAVSSMFNSFLLDATEGLFFTIIMAFIIAERGHERYSY